MPRTLQWWLPQPHLQVQCWQGSWWELVRHVCYIASHSGLPCAMQQRLMEDPLSHALWCTQHKTLGFLTTQDKMPDTKGTRHPNHEIPIPSILGMGISGLG
jgi:hypothetical protein